MRISACFILFQLFSAGLFAQQDSVIVVNTKWETKRIFPGVLLKHCRFTDSALFNSNQNITILEVKQKRRLEFDLAAEAKLKKTTSEFGIENNAIAAINGTFFDVANGGSVDYIRLNGHVVNENRTSGANIRAIHQKAAVVIDDGKLSISQWDGSGEWEKRLKGDDVMLSGPMLLDDFANVLSDTSAFSKSRHPRSVIAVDRKNRVLLITIDGRHQNSAGMSLSEISRMLRWMKCKDAINLDGGGSTTLWVRDEPENGVVNYPSDNKKWDHEGQRKVANVVLLKKK
ncbi:phosphodiester glycosidase family protein [Arcticibacter tournemirensis]